jgi:DNA gyrase/topoisomerase IV subunit B
VANEVDLLDHIRKRPGMYIGGTGSRGALAVALEVIANSFDQVLAGQASRIEVSADPAGEITVRDDGAGISVEVGEDGRPFLERVFTEMHRTATADGHRPHVHLGASGLGLFPMSALSELVEVETCDGTAAHRQTFARGLVSSPLTQLPLAGQERGTTITFRLDREIFDAETVPVDQLEEVLATLAALVPGVLIVAPGGTTYGPWTDLRPLHQRTWPSGAGAGPFLIEHATPEGRASVALSFADPGDEHEITSRSFCNWFETTSEGAALVGLEDGLGLVLGPSAADALGRTRSVLHVVLDDPQYVGPTRTTLDSPEAVALVAGAVAQHLPAILAGDPALDAELRGRR